VVRRAAPPATAYARRVIRRPDLSPSPGTAAPLRGGAQIAVAVGIMNLTTYGYTILAARQLGPDGYGAFAAVMNLLLVVSVISLALQATAARRISADRDHVAQIEASALRTSRLAAYAVGGALLVLSPVVDRLLRLDDLRVAVLVALAAVPLTVMGGQAGVLQGERRWGALSAVYLAGGVPRLVVGASLLAWRPTELVAVAGVAVASLAPMVVGWWALRRDRAPGPAADHHGGRAILRESLLNSQALLAFFALSNLDLVVARNVLDPHSSGLYAAGLILTKAMLFLPQFVVVLAFPTMAIGRHGRALAVGSLVIGGLGGVGVLACWQLPDLALAFIGGPEFAGIREELWSFALLGTVLAVLQLLVYSVLAHEGRASSLLVWVALVVMLSVGSTAGTAGALVARVIAVDLALLLALLASSRWRGRVAAA
jgi:O-antigen/teichoic acid export membrane protein